MVLYGALSPPLYTPFTPQKPRSREAFTVRSSFNRSRRIGGTQSITVIITAVVSSCLMFTSAGDGLTAGFAPANAPDESETLENIPQTLSGSCLDPKDCKRERIQRPKDRKAESCTVKCVTTCIRGGEGSPGEGPLNIRKPIVVFKSGFRSRRYCLVECSDICNLIDEDYGP